MVVANILVTGAGAILGQGILRCLRESKRTMNIHTVDPDWRATGHWLGNKAHLVPFANDPDYMNKIIDIVVSEEINIIMIGTDSELSVFAKEKVILEEKYGVKVVVSSENVINIANNKWLTANFLQKNGFPYPLSVLTTDKARIDDLKKMANYPYFAKPIDGARSRGIVVVKNAKIMDEICSYANNLVVQEYLPDNEEYTSGCLVFGEQCKAIVTLRRDLKDGNTYRAYYDENCENYNHIIKRIAEKLNIDGPCNFQFRIRNGEPVVFEINSRFSGTTPLRSVFGFNEVDATLGYILDGKEIIRPVLRNGIIMRSWSDIYVDEKEIAKFIEQCSLTNPQCISYPFKERRGEHEC